jgi:sialidase-1
MEHFEQQDLFVSGEGGYVRYRIPALAVTTQGTVLAFCEARKYTGSDSDQIDLFLRRSHDDGRTFGEVQVVASQEDWVCGNPAPVVDRDTGRIWLPFCKNLKNGDETMICEGKAPRQVWMTYSDDDGATWAEPWEITREVKRPNWSWYATGPCHGIQLQAGRLVVPCDHIVFENYNRQDPYHSHVIYSDDHGATWQIGGKADEGTNESTVLETADGGLYLNCRNKTRLPDGGNHRAVAWSADHGESFAPSTHDTALLEPLCQASVCRYTTSAEHDRNRVLFSNPASRTRDHLTIRLSYDECRSWPVRRLLHAGPAAYSDLCVTREMQVCCLYERGEDGPYERITLARFDLEWLSGGRERLSSE